MRQRLSLLVTGTAISEAVDGEPDVGTRFAVECTMSFGPWLWWCCRHHEIKFLYTAMQKEADAARFLHPEATLGDLPVI